MSFDSNKTGLQRHSLQRLQSWETLGYGMFIHFGMGTFEGVEASKGDSPSDFYAPTELDVEQWIRVAHEAGMRYVILTAKHHSGHCLWPSRHTDYHVGTSGNTTDVVGEFVAACRKYGIVPGLYYASWDEHHVLGSLTPHKGGFGNAYTSQAYRDFQLAQVEELLTQYGPIGEFWIDIPNILGPDGRVAQYEQIARLQPDCLAIMNQGFTTGDRIEVKSAWPTDLCAIERHIPAAPLAEHVTFSPWFSLDVPGVGQGDYYIPGEACDTLGKYWFFRDFDRPRSDAELLGMYFVTRERGCNFLLNVPPDKRGLIPDYFSDALFRLKENIARFGA